MLPKTLIVALATPLLITSVTGCSSMETDDGRLQVQASFYPLAFVAERVGGDLVSVTSLTKPGSEPHDLELSPRQVSEMAQADLIVYEKGFQPAVDEAVQNEASDTAFDVSTAADLMASTSTEESEAGGSALDPHFWLDPVRLATVTGAMAAEFSKLDPAHADAYRANAESLEGELQDLDSEFESGLADCAVNEIVTGHQAFGYLASRYGLTQIPIAGVDPEQEPNAAAMRDIVATIKEHDVRTVYAETLVSPALAETIARESGAQVEVLDPIEGITEDSAGQDYLAVMRANLATLEKGQECR